MELIDKSAIVAEINKKLDKHSKLHSFNYGAVKDLESLLNFLDTLEVKEVDFERELSKYVSNGIHRFFPNVDDDYCKMDSVIWQDYVIETAKHFYELGLKVNNPITATDRGTAEEIIVCLKHIGQEHCINLTKEIQWLRGIVKKG